MRASLLAVGLLLALPAWGQQRRLAPPFGDYKGEIRDEQGVIMKVAMRTPGRMHPARRVGLILAHHGMNGSENSPWRGMTENLQRIGFNEEYILICGKSQGAGWQIDEDGPRVLRLIEWAKKSYPVDPRRVYMWGSSNGASFTGRFAWANQNVIAGAVGYCGGYNFRGEVPSDPGDARTEFYFVHGDKDDQVNVESARRGARQLQQMGYRYVYRELDGHGHGDIFDGRSGEKQKVTYAVRDDFMRWIHALRHKEIAPTAKEQKWLAQFQTSKAESLLRRKSTYVRLALLGGPVAADALVKGLQAGSDGTRVSAAAASGLGRFGPKVTKALAALVGDEASRVRLTAIKALGYYAAWNDDTAQAALCKVASTVPEKKGSNSRERALAIEGLAKSVELALPGNFDDKQVFWTLVTLLDDADGRIRAAAFQALAKAVPDGFGYHPKLTDKGRPGPLARWKNWCTQKCGPLEN